MFKETKKSDKQKETTYVLYMMASSCFKTCQCRTKIMEKNLYLYYKELSFKKQVSMEEMIENVLNRKIKKYKEIFNESKAESTILKKGDLYYIYFKTGFEILTIKVDEKGIFDIKVEEVNPSD